MPSRMWEIWVGETGKVTLTGHSLGLDFEVFHRHVKPLGLSSAKHKDLNRDR